MPACLQVRNEKARKFLVNMRKKPGVRFESYFPKADKGALRLLKKMLSFDPSDRPSSDEALCDPYFHGLSQPQREPSAQPVSKLAFDFERRKLTSNEVVNRCGPSRPALVRMYIAFMAHGGDVHLVIMLSFQP